MDAVARRDENGADALVNSRSIHIDRRTERQDERRDLLRNAELLRTLHVERQCADR